MALDFVAGCAGGCAGVAVGHPFDTIKVRLQTQDASKPTYRGTWDCFSRTLKAESVRGLYKGLSSPMAGVSVVNAIVFGVHGNIMKKVKDPGAISAHATAGASAGFFQAFVASPIELAKTRMQIQTNTKSPGVYKSPLHCLRSIAKSEGAKGLFRGQAITVVREIPGFAMYFATYETLLRHFAKDEEEAPASVILLAGGTAGIVSWVLTHPVDVIKSRFQADGIEGVYKYKGIWHCLKSSISHEGVSVLGRGISATIVRAFPTNAATFFVVSCVMKAGEQLEERLGDEGTTLKDLLAKGEIFVASAAAPLRVNLLDLA